MRSSASGEVVGMGSAAKMVRVLVQMVAIVRPTATAGASMGDSWRVTGDDFRVCIASRDLPDPMYQRMLTRELGSRLGYQGKASRDKGQVVWYASSAGSADEIAQVAREVLARLDVGHYLTAPVRTERVRGDDWRVCIAWDDLPELMSQQRLTRELSSRLGYQVQASGGRVGRGQVVWSAASAGSAEEVAQAAREVLAREALARPDAGRYRTAPVVRTERWIRRHQDWRDVTGKPSAVIAAELQAEHEHLQEQEREASRRAGFPAYRVRVDVPSHRDVVALAAHLAAQGWGVRRRRRHLFVGAVCEDDAKALVRALSGDGDADAEAVFRVRRVSCEYMLYDPSPY
jgi:hypothetical protein